jgi:hypothetical protein
VLRVLALLVTGTPFIQLGERTMTRRIQATIPYGIIAIAIALATSHGTVTAQNGQAPERSLEGVWLVTITPRSCATGDPIPTAAFEALYTFHKDSTMLASFRNNSLTLERTAAHGHWRRDLGWHQYAFKFVHLRRNVLTGAFAGKQEGAGTLVLSDSGDEFTTDGSSTVFDANGNPVGTSGCSTSAGTRFQLES